MTVKLKDIAQYANVSISTVSRVINNKDRVDDETRQRVRTALEKFQYRPNEVARSLKSKTTKAIGVIVPDISNYFYSKIFKGVEEAAREQGYYVILCNSDADKERETEYTEFLLHRQISGLVIAIEGREAGFLERYKIADIPVVFIDNLPEIDDNFDYVAIDNVKACRILTDHLIDAGHRKIGIVSGSLNESVSEQRYRGWEKALAGRGIPVNKKWVGVVGDVKQESGYRIMQSFLKQPEVPTAIVALNNHLAYGAIRAALEAGLNIPDDLAVVCFDAIDFIGLMHPQVTSIVQPAEDIGRIAGEIIMRKEVNSKTKMFEKVVLEPQLEIKQSSVVRSR